MTEEEEEEEEEDTHTHTQLRQRKHETEIMQSVSMSVGYYLSFHLTQARLFYCNSQWCRCPPADLAFTPSLWVLQVVRKLISRTEPVPDLGPRTTRGFLKPVRLLLIHIDHLKSFLEFRREEAAPQLKEEIQRPATCPVLQSYDTVVPQG